MSRAPAIHAIRTVKKNSNVYIAMTAIWLALASTGPAAYAQEGWVTARVTYVAGQNIYLDAGRDQGILPGDTLTAYRDGVFAGTLAVVSSISDRSVTTFAGEPFAVTRGTELQVQPSVAPGKEAPPPPEVEPEPLAEVAPEREVAYQPVEPQKAQRRTRAGPRVSGRVMLSLNALESNTKWAAASSVSTKRTFATPSMNVHLNVRDLPQGMRLRTRFRTDYRYSASRSIEPTLSVRAYEVLLEKDFEMFSVQAGRFANRYASYSGYWDGALLHFGGKHAGIGTAIGFMPDRSNEGFSTDMPRYAGFAHFEVGDRPRLRYAANVSFNEIRPANHLLTHRFAGLSQNLRWRLLYLRNDLQLDRDPETGGWVASRLQLRGSAELVRGVRVHARYTIRRPYSIYRVQNVLSYRRDQATAGLSFYLGGVSFGANLAFNFVEDAIEGRMDDGRTVGGYLQLPKTGILDLSFAAMASYWQDDVGSSFFFNTGVSRRLGRAQARLQYQYYRTVTFADPLLTHSITMQASVSLGRGFHTSSNVRLQQSTLLRSVAFYTSLWYSF